jgi:predicted RNA binding protein YcfA (HicA-like mRNA interferase family)
LLYILVDGQYIGVAVHTKKHLSFTALRKSIGKHFDHIDDHRQSGRVDFSLHDCLMSALAMMFFDVLRKTIDSVATEDLDPCFSMLFHHLQRGKQLAPYQLDSGYYLVAIDGSHYFCSQKSHCPSCLTYKHSKKSCVIHIKSCKLLCLLRECAR